MKKAIITAAVLIGLISLPGGAAYAAGQVAKRNAIGEDVACNFAYVDAGISPEDASVVKTSFDYEMGKFVYEIGFVANGSEYGYLVDASNGKILKRESEPLPAAPQGQGTAVVPDSAGTDIGLDRAKQIALAMAGLSGRDDVVFSKQALGWDDGRPVYALRFLAAGEAVYAYELDAETGDVLEESFEILPSGADAYGRAQSAAGADAQAAIGIDQAKQLVLAETGLSNKDVIFSKAKLERDDGRLVYDIEFYVNGQAKYEYELDAKTGAILDTSYEAADGTGKTQPGSAPTASPIGTNKLSADQAKSIALKQAGVSAKDLSSQKTRIETEDGTLVYKVEFTANGREYEVEIDARSGAVLEKDSDIRDDDDDFDDDRDRDDDWDDDDDDRGRSSSGGSGSKSSSRSRDDDDDDDDDDRGRSSGSSRSYDYDDDDDDDDDDRGSGRGSSGNGGGNRSSSRSRGDDDDDDDDD